MNDNSEIIHFIDRNTLEKTTYRKYFSDAIVLTKDGKLLLQQRPANWGGSAGCLTAFGGHVEEGETATEAVIRLVWVA